MQSKRMNNRRRRGFTLLEVLLVMGILVVLAAIAVPNLIGVQESSKLKTANIQVHALDDAVNLYNVEYGSFPPSLAALVTPPNPAPPNWKPLMKEAGGLDPWGHPYNYSYGAGAGGSSGTRNVVGPDIWSNGPDGQPNTADDIGNWPTQK